MKVGFYQTIFMFFYSFGANPLLHHTVSVITVLRRLILGRYSHSLTVVIFGLQRTHSISLYSCWACCTFFAVAVPDHLLLQGIYAHFQGSLDPIVRTVK